MRNPVELLTTAKLIEEYNRLTGKGIKKFATRADGERQVKAARDVAAGKTPAVAPTTTTAAPPDAKTPAPAPTTIRPAVDGERPKSQKRSASTTASWSDKSVIDSRSRRDGVEVKGHGLFRSVGEAFKKLNLPLNKHIKFRKELKAEGKKRFTHNEKHYEFVVFVTAKE